MKSLVITVLLFLTLSVGAKAQENAKTFTPEEQAVIDLSNNKWDWMAEKPAYFKSNTLIIPRNVVTLQP